MPNVVRIPVAAGAFDPSDITITDNTSGAFLIKDDAGSPTEYMRIDTTNSAEKINFKVPAGNGQVNLYADKSFGYTANGGAQWYAYGGSNNWFFGNSGTASPGYLRAFSTDFSMQATSSGGVNLQQVMRARGAGTGDSFKVKSATETNFEIDQDSNATFTLDSSSTCNFKVVDNAGAPVTYLDIERGLTERVKIPVVGLETIRAIGGNYVAGVSNTTGINLHTFPLNYANTLLTFDQTDDGTTSNQGTKPGLTVVYSSSATGAATSSGITLQLSAAVPADGTTSPQYLVMHNQNATHSVKFILDGSNFYNGHEVATSGSDAADLIGAGFTLAAGKFAVFSILACRVTNTGDHYFYAVSLHTKT